MQGKISIWEYCSTAAFQAENVFVEATTELIRAHLLSLERTASPKLCHRMPRKDSGKEYLRQTGSGVSIEEGASGLARTIESIDHRMIKRCKTAHSDEPLCFCKSQNQRMQDLCEILVALHCSALHEFALDLAYY